MTGSFDTWEKQKGLTVFLESIFMPLVRMVPDLRLIIAGRFPGAFRAEAVSAASLEDC